MVSASDVAGGEKLEGVTVCPFVVQTQVSVRPGVRSPQQKPRLLWTV